MKQQKTLEKRRIFSERLRKLVTERGTQLNQLAAAVGVNDSAVTQWLSKSAGCKGSNLEKVAQFFSVPVEYLTGAIDYVPSQGRQFREGAGAGESIENWRVRAIRAEERLESAIRQLDAMGDTLKAEARRLQNGHVSVLPHIGSSKAEQPTQQDVQDAIKMIDELEKTRGKQ